MEKSNNKKNLTARNNKSQNNKRSNRGNSRRNKISSKKRKFSIKLFFGFIVFEIVFTALTGLFVLYYGPFENSRKIFVGTAMNSMHYQWLATSFLSDSQIEGIIGNKSEGNTAQIPNEMDTSSVQIKKLNDEGIEKLTFDGNNYTGYALVINDPTRVKIGYTSTLNSDNPVGEETSVIAENNEAVAAINGGAFTDDADTSKWSANCGSPSVVIISNGKVVYDDLAGKASYVTAIDKNGYLFGGLYTTEELLARGTAEAVSFKGPVVLNGEKLNVSDQDGMVSRTLIGQKADGEIVLVVLDSRYNNKLAATLSEAQDVMIELGCVIAIPLDGGKSTTMYYKGEVINNPTYVYGERPIPTAIIVK